MFSTRNKIIVSYIENSFLIPRKYRILTNLMSKGPWHLENNQRHIFAVNTVSFDNNKKLKEFSLRLDNCDIEMLVKHNSITKHIKLDGNNEEYLCRVSYALDGNELTYVKIEKNDSSRYFCKDDENLRFLF